MQRDVDDLMIHDAPVCRQGQAFAHLPVYGLEDLEFVPRAAAQISGDKFQSATVSAGMLAASTTIIMSNEASRNPSGSASGGLWARRPA